MCIYINENKTNGSLSAASTQTQSNGRNFNKITQKALGYKSLQKSLRCNSHPFASLLSIQDKGPLKLSISEGLFSDL